MKTSKQMLPDPEVLDSADQFEAASRILNAASYESGVLLPILNTSIMAVELYLKSLSSERKYVPQLDGGSLVYPDPKLRVHPPSRLLAVVPPDILNELNEAFERQIGAAAGETLAARCEKYDELFMASRYPFDERLSIDGVVMRELFELVNFFRTFVHGVVPHFRVVQL